MEPEAIRETKDLSAKMVYLVLMVKRVNTNSNYYKFRAYEKNENEPKRFLDMGKYTDSEINLENGLLRNK